MKEIVFLLMMTITLFACKKDDDGIKRHMNTESCILGNENNYVTAKIDRGEGVEQTAEVAIIVHERNTK